MLAALALREFGRKGRRELDQDGASDGRGGKAATPSLVGAAESAPYASGPRITTVLYSGAGTKPSFSFSRRIGSFRSSLSVSRRRKRPDRMTAAISARLSAAATPRRRQSRRVAVSAWKHSSPNACSAA